MKSLNSHNGYIDNIEQLSEENNAFRKVLYTTPELQLVLMSLKPGEEIGMETHVNITQFLRVEEGSGKAILEDDEVEISDGFSIVVPAGKKHNVVNTGDTDLKLYSLYTPPEHKHGIIHETKQVADERHHNEEFDGETSLS